MPRTKDGVEIYDRGERLPARDPWIEKIAWLMDSSIPVGRWSVGLDSIVGLIPGFGDAVGALVSMFIVARAVAAGVPRVAVARMLANVAVETLIGAIPLAGDAFDFAFKSNIRNLRIYEESLLDPARSTRRHWAFFTAIMIGTVALIAVIVVAFVLFIRPLVSGTL